MATAEVYLGPPSSSFPPMSSSPPPPAHQTSSAPAMSSTPGTPTSPSNQLNKPVFTPAQLEARAILTHLLTLLSNPTPHAATTTTTTHPHTKYSVWINSHSIPALTTSLYSLIRPQLWHLLSTRLSLDALKSLGGDLRHEGRAIYLNGILGVDKRLRIYVGQSGNLRQRVGQHLNFRYRRDHPSVHYWALEWSVYNVFGVLALIPPAERHGGMGLAGLERLDLVMNVLEMWMCLVFRSLPCATLVDWLPDDGLVDKGRRMAKEGVVGGLNVASPLDQGVEGKDMPFVDLSEETDPVVQEYLREMKRRKGGEVEVVKVKIGDGDMEVDEEERARRKKMYAEKARRYQRRRDTDIVIPQWVFLGALAVGVGVLLLRSSGGPGGKRGWR